MTWIAIDSGRESATHTLVQIPPAEWVFRSFGESARLLEKKCIDM
jgi:hypothetical protein